MRTLLFPVCCFVLFLFISLSSQAGIFPQHRPCVPNSAEVSPLHHREFYPQQYFLAECQDWKVGNAVSLIQPDSLAGWSSLSGQTPPEAWSIKDNILHLKGKGGDIVSNREYENFILEFSWTISKGGNSGIKYRFKKYDGKGWLGLEYQILDDFNTLEGKKPKNNTATLYDILSTDVSRKHLNPNDQLNYGKVVVRGQHIEHYLNGEKVLEITPGTEQWYELVAQSKFNDIKDFGLNKFGKIMIQDHQHEVWFHSITIRELYPLYSPAKFPVHQSGIPCFSESRPVFPVAPFCGNGSNINGNKYFRQIPPQYNHIPVVTTPYVKTYYAPMSVPKHRCIFPNIFNR